MSLGTSKIIKRSRLRPELREVFLQAPFFTRRVISFNLEDYSNFFSWDNPKTEIDRAVIQFLNEEGYNYTGKEIEYWFQHQTSGMQLPPHCDYNYIIRNEAANRDSSWIHTVERERVMSPVTIACYLNTDNIEGGELCISDQDWFSIEKPMNVSAEDIKKYPYEVYKPEACDVLYFEGSKYYHWINPVLSGDRKSMLINFWSKDLQNESIMAILASSVK